MHLANTRRCISNTPGGMARKSDSAAALSPKYMDFSSNCIPLWVCPGIHKISRVFETSVIKRAQAFESPGKFFAVYLSNRFHVVEMG
jgi:hypothetical protein